MALTLRKASTSDGRRRSSRPNRSTTSYFDRQVTLYGSVLEAGVATGAFSLRGPAAELARSMVALEDGGSSQALRAGRSLALAAIIPVRCAAPAGGALPIGTMNDARDHFRRNA